VFFGDAEPDQDGEVKTVQRQTNPQLPEIVQMDFRSDQMIYQRRALTDFFAQCQKSKDSGNP
jgi:hypothetical protein